jgi:hypothetical protein
MYFPKSQYTGNLYTDGTQYVIATSGDLYKGYYFKTFNNELYTGKTPEDGTPRLLIEADKPTSSGPASTFTSSVTQPLYILMSDFTAYDNKEPEIRYLPQPNVTLPTPDDYKQGVFTRYFCKKTNELKYIEIDQKTHSKLASQSSEVAWDLYIPQSIDWYITGNMENIYNLNKSIVNMVETEEKWYGFSQYFKQNFAKYFAT